jgi:hypothetical protein
MLQINIGKGLTMEVEPSRFNTEVMSHIVSIGLRNVLGDAHASTTAKAYPDTYVAKSRELAERKLENLYNGVVRVAAVGGPKAPTSGFAGHLAPCEKGRSEGSREGPCCSGQKRPPRIA